MLNSDDDKPTNRLHALRMMMNLINNIIVHVHGY